MSKPGHLTGLAESLKPHWHSPIPGTIQNSYVIGPDGTRYNQAIESDVSYNTAYSWTTDASKAWLAPENAPLSDNILDVQTVALHEMGHTIGLGDTYLHDIYQYDLSQIMGFYDGVQRTLGSCDNADVKKLYGI